MKYFKTLLMGLVAGTGMMGSSQAEESFQALVPGYIRIQKALASDSLVDAIQEAKQLRGQNVQWHRAPFKSVVRSLEALVQSQSLKDARSNFKKMTTPFEKWVLKQENSDFDVIYCPMAGAKWIQKKGEIENPYFGKEMLRCGEKTS